MSNDHEWLSLIEVSGPFLALPVLRNIFPHGLDALPPGSPQRIRSAYQEWRDAVDMGDAQLNALHEAWIEEVLLTALEIDDEILRRHGDLPDHLKVFISQHDVTIAPDLAVIDPSNGDETMLLIQIYEPEGELNGTMRFGDFVTTPADRMVSLLRVTGCPVGIVTNGEHWMLVHAHIGAVTGFASWYARLWGQEPSTLRAFVNLLNVRRMFGPKEEKLPALYEQSLKYQDDVTDALGEQVRRAVEVLIQALDRADQDRNRDLLREVDPQELYEAGLTVMMRLVFLLAAEERGLLLSGDPCYDSFYAVSSLRMQLRTDSDEILERRRSAWSRLLSLFRAVYGGIEHPTLRLAALGGSLFDPDRFPFLEGRKKGTGWRNDAAEPLPIDDRTVLLLLNAIQSFEGRPLSYRALDVEQIGHVYEGLLEHNVERVEEITLELDCGTKAINAHMTLSAVESAFSDGTENIVKIIAKLSGRTVSAIRNSLGREINDDLAARLLTVCRGDQELRDRILPMATVLRIDPWGYPLVYHAGAFVITAGEKRQESGTHYTPKFLTERIVEETLSPIVYRERSECETNKERRLKTAEELLELKICDPAMGSGAFLVQACRWLSDRLVEAWAFIEENGDGKINSDGRVLFENDVRNSHPLPLKTEDRTIVARRLVAERCLYGVDKNPLAVELAKLSLWLITMSKDRPFGFLDHNLRSGDSLLGIYNVDHLYHLNMTQTDNVQLTLFGQHMQSKAQEALEIRTKLTEIEIKDISNVNSMIALNKAAEELQMKTRYIGDKLLDISIRFAKKSRNLSAELLKLSFEADQIFSNDIQIPKTERRNNNYFHWPIEFPEVFLGDSGGFDAVIGNPPYIGAMALSKTEYAGDQKKFFSKTFSSATGSYDLYVLFFERALRICGKNGLIGFIVPNKILSVEYAKDLRKILIDSSEIKSIIDYSASRVFSASVYPVVLILKQTKTGSKARVESIDKGQPKVVAQSVFAQAPSCLWWFTLTDFSDIVQNALSDTIPLNALASISAAATVWEAYNIIPAISEFQDTNLKADHSKFIVSGNIRPFQSTWETMPVQYLKKRYQKPVINLSSIPQKLKYLAQSPKIMISGMAKRPVAFLDEKGEFLSGISSVVIFDPRKNTNLPILTEILNSKLGALLYLGLYGGLALSKGYLAFGPAQISAFPIPVNLPKDLSFNCQSEEKEEKICNAYSVNYKKVAEAFLRNFSKNGEEDDLPC